MTAGWTAAFLIGLFGGLHCVGMCGPIAITLFSQGERRGQVPGILLYNGGRILTYGLLGALMGLIGAAAVMFDVARFVSLVLGMVMLVLAARHYGWLKWGNATGGPLLFSGLYSAIGRRIRHGNPGSLLLVGMMNGLLPCGLVYIALFNAAMSGSAGEGMAKMALFGAGTLPAMLGLSLLGSWLKAKARRWKSRLLPSMMLVLGLLFVLRGMALGIPYLSPRLEADASGEVQVTCDTHADSTPFKNQ